MENISERRLPPIFKFSLLSCLLPFYGYLHEWRLLLEEINKKARKIWTDHKEAFIFWGKETKKELIINKHQNIGRNWLELFSLLISMRSSFESKIVKRYYANNVTRVEFLLKLLLENEAVIFEKNIFYYKYLSIYIWKVTEIPSILPAISCQVHTPSNQEIKQSKVSDLAKNILDKIFRNNYSVIIKRDKNKFVLWTVLSNIYSINPNDKISSKNIASDDTYNSCKITNWVWKPTKLRIDLAHYMNNKLVKRIKWLSFIESISEVHMLSTYSKSNINNLYQIASEFRKIKFIFSFCFKKETVIEYTFKNYEKLITVIFGGKVCNFEPSTDIKFLNLSYSDIITSENKDLIALKLSFINAERLILKLDIDASSNNNDLVNTLWDLTISEDSIYMIADVRKLDVELDFEFFKRNENLIKHFKSATVRICSDIEFEEAINIMSLNPNLSYNIKVKTPGKYLQSTNIILKLAKLKNWSIVSETLKIRMLRPLNDDKNDHLNKKYSIENIKSGKVNTMAYKHLLEYL